MSELTLEKLLKHVKKGEVKQSPVDKFDVAFFESKELDIHEYRHMKTGAIVPGTTSSIGGIEKVHGLGDLLNKYSGIVVDAETDSIIDRATMTRSSERGTRLHSALEHWVGQHNGKSTLEELNAAKAALLNKEEQDAFQATVDFFGRNEVLKTLDLSKTQTELSLSSAEHGFAGTIDVYGETKSGRKVIVDYKFGREVKRKAGYQTAANALTIKEHYGEDVDRYILHNPEPKNGESHAPKLYSEGKSPKVLGTKEEDTARFLEYLKESKAAGRTKTQLADVEKIAKLNIVNAYKATEKGSKFGMIHIGFGENGEVQQDIVDYFSTVAKDMGLKIKDGVETSKKKGLLYGFEKEAKQTIEQKTNFREAQNVFETLSKKDRVPFLDNLNHEWNDLKQIEVGETINNIRSAGEKVGGDLLSALSKTNNLKAAAIGGAIGAVAGGAYAVLHDNSDPTSPYQENRNYLQDALKGAAVAGGIGYGIQAGMNMRDVGSSAGDMVAHIGNSARGFGGKITDVMLNAWRATGRMR